MSLVEEFYNENKDTYPEISFNEIKIICNAPFLLIKEVMNRGLLKDVRIKYLGLFKVVPSRIKFSLINLEKNYKEKKISKERYEKRKEILASYESN